MRVRLRNVLALLAPVKVVLERGLVHMSLNLTVGSYGGWYVHRGYSFRVCLGWVALTWFPVDTDALLSESMRKEQRWRGRAVVREQTSGLTALALNCLRLKSAHHQSCDGCQVLTQACPLDIAERSAGRLKVPVDVGLNFQNRRPV